MSYEHWGDSIITDLAHDHPNECALGLYSVGYSVVGASVRGRMHIRNGVPREDAIAVLRRDHWLAVAVSDGVGSSRYSSHGASFAVNKVCETLLDQIGEASSYREGKAQLSSREAEPGQEELEKAMLQSFRGAADGLKRHAENLIEAPNPQEDIESSQAPASTEADTSEEYGVEGRVEETAERGESVEQQEHLPSGGRTVALDDLHSTLLVLLLNRRTGTMALAQVGDGLILGLTEDLRAVPLIEPQVPGEAGQTYVITQKDWETHYSLSVIRGERRKRLMTVYLMTDGVADDCQYGPPEDITQRWAKEMDLEIRKYDVEATKERLRRYLSEYQAKGSYDDRTLVAVYRSRHKHPGIGA